MNLRDVVLLKIKIYDVDWYPTIELLRHDETMLVNGLMHTSSRISTAKLILRCFDWKACIGKNDLMNKLLQHPMFVADLRELGRRISNFNDTNVKSEASRHCFYDGLNWLHGAGFCHTDITNPSAPIEKLSRAGKEVLTVLKMQEDFYAAIDFLAPNDTCRYATATEEKLNCTLFGHPEWTESKWLAEHLKWLSGVYIYSRNNAGSLGFESSLSAMIDYLCLVKSWKSQVDGWLAKNNADFRKQN